MKRFFISLAVVLLLSSGFAAAAVTIGTNFGLFGYPKPSCILLPGAGQAARASYIKCVDKYISNAEYDILRIKQAQADALQNAKKKLYSTPATQ